MGSGGTRVRIPNGLSRFLFSCGGESKEMRAFVFFKRVCRLLAVFLLTRDNLFGLILLAELGISDIQLTHSLFLYLFSRWIGYHSLIYCFIFSH